MKLEVLRVCVVVAMLVGATAGDLPPPESSYKILMLLPVSSKSHRNVFMPIAEALADRGHKIVMLTNHPKSSEHPNIVELTHDLPHFREENMNMFDSRKDPTGGFRLFMPGLPNLARDMYNVPAVKELYEKRKDFDLIMVNHMFNELAYPFLHEMPHVSVATPGMDPRQSAVLGNVLNPAYVVTPMTSFPFPLSAWQRFQNTLVHTFMPIYWRHWAVVPYVQKEITKHFPDMPPLLDLERNMSLALLNTHFTITTNVPLLPSQVEVGAMHCRPGKPLPKNLESWISGAGPEGVIYFSLGSVARGNSMPVEYRSFFVEAFRRLPNRVVWKYEGELEGISDNVLISKWLPQQDILAHENVKIFISHGGLLSMQESIYHATPLLVLPIYGDQPGNGRFVENSALGHTLIWEELTVDMIVDALNDILKNPKYQENISKVSAGLRDLPMSPKDKAVFWTEYVIRHKGAPQLRSPATQLSWVEYLMLDVLFGVIFVLLLVIYILRRVFSAILSKILGSKKSKKKFD